MRFVPWLALALMGCDPAPATLVVQVRTDLGPVVELVRVDVRVARTDGSGADRRSSLEAGSERDWGRGVRVAEHADLPHGAYRIDVEAHGAEGLIVARPARVTLDGGVRVVTLLLTRDCAGVTCPGMGSGPNETACLAGRCVDEDCVEEDPSACGTPDCTLDADCSAPADMCAQAECTESGVCFTSADHSSCGDDEICSPDLGCVPIVCSPAPESCNLIDDDCDGSVDEASVIASFDGALESRISAQAGSRIFVAYGTDLEDAIFVSEIAAGTPTAMIARRGVATMRPVDIEWNGSDGLVVTAFDEPRGNGIRFDAFDATLASTGQSEVLGSATYAARPSVAWAAPLFGIAYEHDVAGREVILHTVLPDATGGRSIDVSSMDGASSRTPVLLHIPVSGTFGVVWQESDIAVPGLYFRDHHIGDFMGLPQTLLRGLVSDFDALWDGRLLVVSATQTDRVELDLYDASGNRLDGPFAISSGFTADAVHMTSGAGRLGLVWREDRGMGGRQTFFRELDPDDGLPFGPALDISELDFPSLPGATFGLDSVPEDIAWTGSAYLATVHSQAWNGVGVVQVCPAP